MKRRSFVKSLAASLVFPLTSFGRDVEVPRALEAKRGRPLIEHVDRTYFAPGSVAFTEKAFTITGDCDSASARFLEHYLNSEPQRSKLMREVERRFLDEYRSARGIDLVKRGSE